VEAQCLNLKGFEQSECLRNINAALPLSTAIKIPHT